MRISQLLETLPPLDRERLLGRVEGMQMAMRICRNRAVNCNESHVESILETVKHIWLIREAEAELAVALIRLVQVQIASGKMLFGDLHENEQAEIDRIY